jgi:hypothetical protein
MRDLSYLVGERVFAGDDPVGFALASPGEQPTWRADSPRQLWLPRGALRRLVFLGRAYSLHTLGNVDMIHTTRMNSPKAGALREELDFLESIVRDPHVEGALRGLAPLLHACEKGDADDVEFVVVPGVPS